MALLVYGVTLLNAEPAEVSTAVGDSVAVARESHGLRVYRAELRDPELCLGNADALQRSALVFHRALREVLAKSTLLPFRFPTLFESEDALDQHLESEASTYIAALERIGDSLQYELVAAWTTDAPADTARPVSGREYLERRQQWMSRVSALEEKLKAVTGDSVRQWRSRQERGTHRWFALVWRSDVDRFRNSLRSAAPSEGVRLRLSGPWPPSEFISETRSRG